MVTYNRLNPSRKVSALEPVGPIYIDQRIMKVLKRGGSRNRYIALEANWVFPALRVR